MSANRRSMMQMMKKARSDVRFLLGYNRKRCAEENDLEKKHVKPLLTACALQRYELLAPPAYL